MASVLGSPVIGVALLVAAFVGIVVMWQGAIGKEPDLYGVNAALKFVGEGVQHPDEPHPKRLFWTGVAILVGSLALLVLWGTTLATG